MIKNTCASGVRVKTLGSIVSLWSSEGKRLFAFVPQIGCIADSSNMPMSFCALLVTMDCTAPV